MSTANLYSLIINFRTRQVLGEVFLIRGKVTVFLPPLTTAILADRHNAQERGALANRVRASDPSTVEAFHLFAAREAGEVGLTYPLPISERLRLEAAS